MIAYMDGLSGAKNIFREAAQKNYATKHTRTMHVVGLNTIFDVLNHTLLFETEYLIVQAGSSQSPSASLTFEARSVQDLE